MKFIQKYKIYILEVIFLIILSLTPLLWFKPGHVVIGVDSGYPVDYEKYFEQRVFTWLGSQNFGIDMSAEVGVMPYSGLTAVISMLGFSQYDVQKVLFVFWFLLITFSIYVFLSYLSSKKEYWIVRIAGTIIYSFSLHLYSFWLQGEQPILASYVIFPLFSLFLLRFAQGLSTPLKTAIYLNIVYFLFSSGGVRGIPLIGPVIVTSIVITVYYFFINFKKEGFSYIKRFLILSIFSLILLILCNAYFLYPFISSFLLQYSNQVAIAGGITGAIDWARFISTHTSFTNIFRLHGDNSWYSNPHLWANAFLTNPILIIISFIFPVFAFASPILVDRKERKIIILFLFLGLLGIFFSAGAHLPSGYLYLFLMEHLPGFAAFRSGYYKFMPIVYFSFAVLVGYGLHYISNKFPNLKARLIGIFAITVLLLYHYPYFTGVNFDFNKPFSTMVKIPDYVTNFAKMQESKPDQFRTLVVPPAGAFNIKTYTWGYWNSYPLFPLLTDRGFVLNDAFVYNENENRFINVIYDSLRKKDLNTFVNSVNNTNIKYILLTKDVAKDYAMSVSENPSKYSQILEDKNNFKLIWEEGEWQLYEIILANPQKIGVYNFLINRVNEDMPIDNLLYTNSFPFVDNKSLSENKNLPIKSDLIDFPCISCVLLAEDPTLAIAPASINPSSLFYRFKLQAEVKLLDVGAPDQKIDALLGLSRKRVAEIDNLNYLVPDSQEKWLSSTDLLYSYWQEIADLYNKEFVDSLNYPLLKRISQYLVLERNTIVNVMRVRDYKKEDVLGSSLVKTLKEMNSLNEKLDIRLNEKDWRSNFVYDISKANDLIYINQISLPRDIFNNPVYPTSYEIDGVYYPYYLGQESINLPKNKKTLTLTFKVPNLFVNPEKLTINYKNEVKNCLASTIENYVGLNKYLISVNTKDEDKGMIYVIRKYNVFKTEDYIEKTKDNNGFNPDINLETYTAKTNKYTYTLWGSPNDTDIKVYFCSGKNQSPEEIFNNINITQNFTPLIYGVFNKKSFTNPVPQVTFKKIDSTYYKVFVKNAKSPFVLSFAERYSPLWEAKIKGSVEKDHFTINGYANGWYINNNGDYNIDLVFSTQSKFEKGLIITFFSLLTIVSYLVIDRFKKQK